MTLVASPSDEIVPPELLTRARQGYLREELKLAGDYYAGRGVGRDPYQSAYWYRKAADQGNAGAQVELGYFYLEGIGVDRDAAQAARWFERAAASGNQQGELNLAVLYLKGTGLPKETALAVKLLQGLAVKGDARGQSYLGMLYMMGAGVEKNMPAAEKLFKQAAKQHNPEAEYSLGTLYSVVDDHPKDFGKAADYLRRSASEGYVPSMHSLGLLLVRHPELKSQPEESVTWLTAASTGGAWRSSITLGVLARDGQGRAKNMSDAYRWFLIAAQQGGPEAEKLLRAELKHARTNLAPTEQTAVEKSAAEWLIAHPHQDAYKILGGLQSAYYPVDEVYTTEVAQEKSSQGATAH